MSGGPMASKEVSENDATTVVEEGRDLVDDDDFDWEEGELGSNAANGDYEKDTGKEWNGEVTLEVEGSAGKSSKSQQKPQQRRATARDKEFAEMVHKAHLLCLLGRGRIVEAACDDPLLQASILSVLPPSLGLSVHTETLNTKILGGLVSWFMRSFRVLLAGEGSSSSKQEQGHEEFSKRLLQSVQKQAGSSEEVAALSVALLRALGFATRYVMVLNVASLKPDADSLEASGDWRSSSYEQGPMFSPQGDLETSRVASLAQILARSAPQQVNGNQKWICLMDSERASPPTDGKEHPEAKGRGRRSPKPSPRGSKKGKGSGRGQGKTGSASSYQEVAIVADEQGVKASGQKRNGDEEFERQLAMAIAATSAAAENKDLKKAETQGGVNDSPSTPKPFPSPAMKLKGIKGLGTSGNASLRQNQGSQKESGGSGGAVWSRKLGPVMHWAEVYCSGEGTTGRWVHIDAARGIVDGADKIEAAAAACRLPLRYVVAFAGRGAKDVTRRYVTLWSTVGPLRINGAWWDNTLNPLKQLEAAATAGPASVITSGQSPSMIPANAGEATTRESNGSTSKPVRHSIHEGEPTAQPEHTASESTATESKVDHKISAAEVDPRRQRPSKLSAPYVGDRSVLEDMEMETKAFTEPLPTNQQAYKSHHLYVLEKWLTKYQALHPKGPVLGYCAGHAVYPRTCVQVLHTPDRWLREGFKVRSGETPAKVVKASRFAGKEVDSAIPDEDGKEEKLSNTTMTSLYGKWQTEAWQPPRAVNGIVPKNERGQVDAWSEKCIPPGTVHLRFPRLVPIAQRLEIDFAPAMVGFEIRKGRALPVYEGIVVCVEFKDVILDVYTYEEDVRFRAFRKKREEQASKRWWNLLHSMATRQRLQAAYEGTPPVSKGAPAPAINLPMVKRTRLVADVSRPSDSQSDIAKKKKVEKQRQTLESHHVHDFPEESQSYDEDSGIRTKQCLCGFTYYVEEM